jgi:Family of unknown function (DUF6879)
MTRRPITEDEFDELLRSFERSAFRLETRDSYALGYERAEFERFLAGTPTPPPEVDWWRPWLKQLARFAHEHKRIGRVRVLAEPPTDYQQWEMWAGSWHAQAGERIRYMPRSRALRIGLPLDHDWWLLDNERLIIMEFTDSGEIKSKTLVTGVDEEIDRCILWRNLAVRNATPAEEIAAA